MDIYERAGITDMEDRRTLWEIVENLRTMGVDCTVAQLLTAIGGGHDMVLANLDIAGILAEVDVDETRGVGECCSNVTAVA